jgi:hypothetical protein
MSGDFSTTIRAQRFMLWYAWIAGSVFFFAMVWLMEFFPPMTPSLSADEVVALYSAHNVKFKIGVVLALLSGCFMLPYTLVISLQLARIEKGVPVWAYLQAMCGLLGTIFIWGPALIWGIAAFSVERAPELTVMLHEAGWLTLITPLTCFPLNLIPVIVMSFAKTESDGTSAFPRWIGYLTAWQLVQSFGGPVALFFKSGIFSWSGLIPFWLPLGLFGGWFMALSFTMWRALDHQEKVARA